MSGDHNMYASGSGDGQRSGWRKRQVLEMAREAGWMHEHDSETGFVAEAAFKFAELVRADEAEKYKWDVHSCGPTCTKVGCVAVRKAVEAEREACAKVCEDIGRAEEMQAIGNDYAEAIRARGDKHD